jgi:hypothetical protein
VGFFHPFGLFFLLSIPLLVLIYFWARSRSTVEVSSLILFEELPVPVARLRSLHIDLPFWLEVVTLSALSLAAAGLYLRMAWAPESHRPHALVFDLGVSMGTREGGESRLDLAKRQAASIISGAPAGQEFMIEGYALEASTVQYASADRRALSAAVADLRAFDVPAEAAALRAALTQVRGGSKIDLFTDHAPPPVALSELSGSGKLELHRLGSPADNVAIAALDPGVSGLYSGSCVLRAFAPHPLQVHLRVESERDGTLYDSDVVVKPGPGLRVSFNPPAHEGLVHARIVTPDSLSSDNERYAYARGNPPLNALVLSPDRAVRADLSKILFAIDRAFTVQTADPADFRQQAVQAGKAKSFDLVVMHDCYVPVAASSALLVFPNSTINPETGLRVGAAISRAELEYRRPGWSPNQVLILKGIRQLQLPAWMHVVARAMTGSAMGQLPAAAEGSNEQARTGVISFDIRNHYLFDPDHLAALVLTVDVLNELLAPADMKVVSTGEWVRVPARGAATLLSPRGGVEKVKPDQFGVVRFRALEAGRYQLRTGAKTAVVAANYFDASASDLSGSPSKESASTSGELTAASASTGASSRAALLTAFLALVALILFLGESATLVRNSIRQRSSHV